PDEHRKRETAERQDPAEDPTQPREVCEARTDRQRRVRRVTHAEHHVPPLRVQRYVLPFGRVPRPIGSYPLPGVPCTKSTTTRASCSPRSSCRKCPAPPIVVGGRRVAPGISLCRPRSPPAVIGSESLNVVRNGFSQRWSLSHARRFASDAGSSGLVGTSTGNWRAPSLYDSSGKGAS